MIKPTIETIAGLYSTALQQRESADLAVHRVLESAARHGYTEDQVSEQAARAALHPEAR